MNQRITAGAATLMTSLTGLAHITRLWPAPTGRHRAPRGVVTQAFRECLPCGSTAAVVVHADGSAHCTNGHPIPAGGAR